MEAEEFEHGRIAVHLMRDLMPAATSRRLYALNKQARHGDAGQKLSTVTLKEDEEFYQEAFAEWTKLRGMKRLDAMRKFTTEAKEAIARFKPVNEKKSQVFYNADLVLITRSVSAKELEILHLQISYMKHFLPIEERAEIWGLYKQATVGKTPKGTPDALDLIEKTKLKAWKNLKEMSPETARQEYITKAGAIIEKYKALEQAFLIVDVLEDVVDDQQLIELFSLFNQIRYGDHKKEKMGDGVSPFEKAQIDGWKSKKGMDGTLAVQQAIARAAALRERYEYAMPPDDGKEALSEEVTVQFVKADQRVRSVVMPKEGQDAIKMYALYKQARFGDCAQDFPDRSDELSRKKFSEWKSLKGMTRKAAAVQYIVLSLIVFATYPLKLTRDQGIKGLSAAWSKEFQFTMHIMRNFAGNPSLEEKAELRAWFCQIAIGDYDKRKPDSEDPEEVLFIETWKAKKGKKLEAVRELIKRVNVLTAQYGLKFPKSGEYGFTASEAQALEEASQAMRFLKSQPTIDEGAQLYGYLKQATHGNCQEPSPSTRDNIEEEQYAAWDHNKGMSKSEACKHYVRLARRIINANGVQYPSMAKAGLSDPLKNQEFEDVAFATKFMKLTPRTNLFSRLYSLYQQAVAGDCNLDSTSDQSLQGQTKLAAWKQIRGMPKDKAARLYVLEARRAIAHYGVEYPISTGIITDLAGKVVFVGGASHPIGVGTIIYLLRQGATVVATSRSKVKLDFVQLAIRPELRERLHCIQAALADEDHVESLLSRIRSQYGELRYVVAACGYPVEEMPTEDLDLEQLKAQVEATMMTNFCLAKVFMPYLAKQPGSSFTFVTEAVSEEVPNGNTLATIAHSSLQGLAKAIRTEYRDSQVVVNELRVGLTVSPEPEILVAPTREPGSNVIGHDRIGRLVTAVANSRQKKVFNVKTVKEVEVLRDTLSAYF